MSKAKIIDKKSIESILGEKKILSELSHPFIVNMIYSFQDFDYLYLVMELLSGGNLRYNLSLKKRFNEKQIKFLIGCIMVGLKYIHGQNILHRDIKPENLVFEQNGYLRITDFGIAKHYVVNNKKDTSGTIGYLAPEVLCNVNHNFSIDYYAVGIITYELMYGHRPYLGKNKHEVKQLILTRQAKIDYDDLPYGFSNDIADFINGLIQRKPKNRLGKNEISEVLNHPWFDDFDWDNCAKKKLKAPYIPNYGDNFDKNYCLQSNKIGTETMERYDKIMSKENIYLIFKEFNCNKIPQELKVYSNKKTNDKMYSNNMNFNNISSNMSTTSISRNNKQENKQNNLRMYKNNNNMNNNRNIIKNNILNKDIENALYENNNFNNNNINKSIAVLNQKKYINYLKQKIIEANNMNLSNYNVPNKTYRNDYINKKNKINYIGDMVNLNISGINHNNNNNKNIIYNKNKKEKINRNISAKYLNRNKSKILFNNATIDSNANNNNNNNMRRSQISSYKNKKSKLMNHSMKVTTKKTMNNYYNMKVNEKNKTNNIIIPKTKKDYLGKDLIPNNQTTYYHSTIYSKKKTNSSTKKLTSSNSMKNLYGNNNYFFKEQINNNNISMNNINNKSKSNIYDSGNSSRSSKNILNFDSKYHFLNYSMNKKNEMENNNDIYYEIKYKNNNKYSTKNNKTRDELNYDYLYDRYKNKKNGSNI